MATPAAQLRALLDAARDASRCELMPACHDALSAKLIQNAGFKVAFMSGFAVSASQLALPDAGLISYGEQLGVGRNLCAAVDAAVGKSVPGTDRTAGKLLVIGDGDTGFGGSGNVRRTIEGYAQAGFAGISIEDQVFPKRCAYAGGVAVVAREEAIARVRCAIAARDEMKKRCGLDLVIVARTDCRRAAASFDEVLWRCQTFATLGADVVYAEGLDRDELGRLCTALGPRVHTMLAQVERRQTLTLILILTPSLTLSPSLILSLRPTLTLTVRLCMHDARAGGAARGAPDQTGRGGGPRLPPLPLRPHAPQLRRRRHHTRAPDHGGRRSPRTREHAAVRRVECGGGLQRARLVGEEAPARWSSTRGCCAGACRQHVRRHQRSARRARRRVQFDVQPRWCEAPARRLIANPPARWKTSSRVQICLTYIVTYEMPKGVRLLYQHGGRSTSTAVLATGGFMALVRMCHIARVGNRVPSPP
jgi:2-methylisocitrate lyase-like PEP mutase family enzyme